MQDAAEVTYRAELAGQSSWFDKVWKAVTRLNAEGSAGVHKSVY